MARAKTSPKPSKPNAFDLLKAKCAAAPAKSKTNIPEAIFSGQAGTHSGNVANRIAQLHDLLVQEDDTKTQIATLKSELSPDGDKERIAFCLRDGKLYKSVRLIGAGRSLTFTRADNYAKMNRAEEEARIVAVVGPKNYEKYFGTKRSVSINLDSLDPNQINAVCAAIQQAIPADKLGEVIQSNETIHPSEQWTHDVVFNKTVADLSQRLIALKLAVPFAASFKR